MRILLVASVEKRIKSIPFDAERQHSGLLVMFSGGLDSTLIAAIICEVLPQDIAIDLVNVSFAPESSADRFTALFSFYDLKKLYPARKLRLICADYSMDSLFAVESYLLELC